MFNSLFTELGITDNSAQLFSDLLEKGPSSARLLAERLGIPRPSVYDHLKVLIKKGLVTERNEENKKVFMVEDMNNIPALIQSKIDNLQSEKKNFEEILPSLLKQSEFVEPKIKFFSGKEGLQQVMNHIMWHDNIETTLMWPMSEMAGVLGKQYLYELNKKRIKRKISIRGIYPHGSILGFKEYPFLGVGSKHLREIRIAPNNMKWHMGYWMYEDKVAFVSSKKESFGFVIHSRDFAELMKTQFEVIWKESKTVKPEPKYTDEFLKEIGEL